MSYVIRFAALAGANLARGHEAQPGDYLIEYDPDGMDGFGTCTWSPIPDKALTFDSPEEALDFYTQQSTTRPLRADGKPNRPLTANTVSVEQLQSVSIFSKEIDN